MGVMTAMQAPTARRLGPLGVAAALALSGCSSPAAADDGVYRIGLITSQTGPGSQLGIGELRGAELAVKQINAAGGVDGHELELITADDQSNPSQAVLQARKMLGRVGAFVGPSTSGPCKAIGPLAESAEVIDYCLSPGLKPEPGGWQWSASVATHDLTSRLIDYWKDQGITRIGLLTQTDSSGAEGAVSAKEAIAETDGMVLAGEATFSPDAVSVTAQLQQIAKHRPQALVVWATGAGAGVAFKGMGQVGLDVPVATTDGNLTYAFVERVEDFLPDPLLIPATRDFWDPEEYPNDEVRALEASYRDEYAAAHGEQPDFGPGVAYDAVYLVAEALERAEGDSADARAELEKIRDFDGVVGTYNFSVEDHRGLSEKDVAIVQATKDGFEFIGGVE
ncbi:ABC transporter substrate-binding protein [Nocardioides sp. NPDC058538]|uniref:ABC transporter substrate-binding protein n=1 Tax=Nocardioides sp. NPDC058538 TaxID=3346542 RepID=UPI00366370FC